MPAIRTGWLSSAPRWVFALGVLLGGALWAQGNESVPSHPDDPWEGFNRRVFAFNDTLDRYALKPIARGYQWLLPQWADDSVTRFFNNLREPRNIANALLQGKWQQGGQETGRFVANSTLGVAGLFDVARRWSWTGTDEDFGQTLGTWGAARGPYVVLPFLGPSTVRNTVGMVPDYFLNPRTWIDDDPTRFGLLAADVIDTRADLLVTEKAIIGDRYSFIRNAYLQRRAFLTEGEVEDDFEVDVDAGDDDAW